MIAHREISARIETAVALGDYPRGQRLPVETHLAAEHAVSRTVIRRALHDLVARGVLEHRPDRAGTYVASHPPRTRCLHVLGVGRGMHSNLYTTLVATQAEQAARRLRWRVCLHFADDAETRRDLAAEIEADESAVGALLLGTMTPAETAEMAQSRLPWVRIGDFKGPSRPRRPPLHQVLGDVRAQAECAARCLVEAGSRRPAVLVSDPRMVWTRDMLAGSARVFAAAGIPAGSWQSIDLASLRDRQTDTLETNARQRTLDIERQFARWKQTGEWPDGLLMYLPDMGRLEWCEQHDTEAAARLANAPLVLVGFDEHMAALAPYPSRRHPILVLLSMADQIDRAVALILERHRQSLPPRREFVGRLRVVAAAPEGKSAAPSSGRGDAHGRSSFTKTP